MGNSECSSAMFHSFIHLHRPFPTMFARSVRSFAAVSKSAPASSRRLLANSLLNAKLFVLRNLTVKPANGYAGDVEVTEVWEELQKDPNSFLVDVRSLAEWIYVGVPDLSKINKPLIKVEWGKHTESGLKLNDRFSEQLMKQLSEIKDFDPDKSKLFFLCRSGTRSQHAARLLTKQGLSNCYNIMHGFEGDLDENKHRGKKAGWKAAGLPFVQS